MHACTHTQYLCSPLSLADAMNSTHMCQHPPIHTANTQLSALSGSQALL